MQSRNVIPAVPNTRAAMVRSFDPDANRNLFQQSHFAISGVTRDSAGDPLAGCTVTLFETASELFRASSVSDASGAFSFWVNGDRTFFLNSYLSGSPDVAGTTVNTLLGSVPSGSPPEGGGYTYVYQQDFESGALPDGWTVDAGSITWNYATNPAPLWGSFSAEMADGSYAHYSPLGQLPEVWTFVTASVNDVSGVLFFLFDQFGGTLLKVTQSGTELNLSNPGGTLSTVGANLAIGTTFSLWTHYLAGSGADAVVELWWSLNDIKPGTDAAHYASVSTGTTTAGVDQVAICALFGSGGINIFDKLRVSTSAIGSNPN